MYSLVIPVYKNEASIPALVEAVEGLNKSLEGKLEVVFVVDGSPDRSYDLLYNALQHTDFKGTLIEHSRNFGAFAAIRTGLSEATGPYFAIMAADLQEPTSLILEFFKILTCEPVDVAIGLRKKRNDPFLSRLASKTFWALYRRLVQKEMPPGGADIFACNLTFRDHFLKLLESNSSPVGLLFWLGFRRKFVAYDRLERQHGKSAWTFRRKLRYMMDSVFAFTDLPIRILVIFGIIGLIFFISLGTLVLVAKISGKLQVPGYAATILTISFFAALNSLGLGVIGSYVWRAFENTKARPLSIVMTKTEPKKEKSE